MALLTWKFWAIALVVASMSSFGAGAWAVYKYTQVEKLEAQNVQLKTTAKRFKESLGFNQALDDEDNVVEVSNEEIANAITKKVSGATGGKFTCVSGGSMRELAKLR